MPTKSKKTLNDEFTEVDNHWQQELKKFKPLKPHLNSKKNSKQAPKKDPKKLIAKSESTLWQKITKNFKPLPAKFNNIVPPTKEKPLVLPLSKEEDWSKTSNFTNYNIQIANKKDLRKIKTNKIVINKTLDLHSYTVNDAKNYFYEFIIMAVNNNYKLVQIITGKGNNSKGEKGILRSALLQWLTDEKLKPYVLSYSPVYDSTGSYGAFYIFLRKK
ncbi:Smr domain conataining protein [Candidatus Hepatincola sp. Av]